MIRFYAPEISHNPVLPEEESKHCTKVVRHTAGDEIEVVDGKGALYKCIVKEPNPKATRVEIVETICKGNHWPCKIAVAIAPTKNPERMEWMVEKLTEMGVDRIILMKCARSERKEMKPDRLEKKIVSAMKQSLKTVKPELSCNIPFGEIVSGFDSFQKFICYCDEALGKEYLGAALKPHCDTIVLIGPEGDFSPEEVEKAINHGFITVSLGESRLRTETAAIVATDIIHIVNNLAQK